MVFTFYTKYFRSVVYFYIMYVNVYSGTSKWSAVQLTAEFTLLLSRVYHCVFYSQ